MAALNTYLKAVLMASIRTYRYVLAPLLGTNCRFEPSCSQYSLEVINHFGCIRGGYLTLRRLVKCHPWHEGGYDPIPFKTDHYRS